MAVKRRFGLGRLKASYALVGRPRVIDICEAEINFAAIKLRYEGAGPSRRLDAHLHFELVIHQLPDHDAAGIEDRPLRIGRAHTDLLGLCGCGEKASDAASTTRSSLLLSS